jgi:hypothetical protein
MYVAEVGVFESIRNDCYLETVLRRVTYRQAYTVHCHRAFVDSKVAVASDFLILFILAGEVSSSIGIFDGRAECRIVNMALYYVSL